MADIINDGADRHGTDSPTESIQRIVCQPARNATVISDKGHTSNSAKPRPRDATCGGCLGTGIHAHFPARRCDYCNGTGLFVDECRIELADAISEKLADTCDLDVNWLTYARAVIELLEERGVDVAQVARP